MKRVTFIHVEKTGGTSLTKLLQQEFRPDRTYHFPTKSPSLHQMTPGELGSLQFFAGHFSYDDVLRYIPPPFDLITLLREPAARLISSYYFQRSHKLSVITNDLNPDTREAWLLAKEHGLLEYIRGWGERIGNGTVATLGGIGPPQERLRRAKARLRTMTAFGVTERMDESVRHIFSKLGLTAPAEIPRLNTFESLTETDRTEPVVREEFTDEIRDALNTATALDRELYAYATDLFDERLARDRVPDWLPAVPGRELRVLYDVSVLGYGQFDDRCRTGVYRTIENIARQIVRTPGVDLGFCAAQNWRTVEGARVYLQAHRDLFPNVPLVVAEPFDRVLRGLKETRDALNDVPAGKTPPGGNPDASVFLANLSESISQTIGLFPTLTATVDAESLRGYDIYHSTFYPVRRHLRRADGARIVATVYDLIPLLLPELFAGDGNNELEFQRMVETLQGLTPDDHVLCISKSVRDDLLGFSPLDPDKVHVTYLAADPTVFVPVSDAAALAAVRARYGIGEGPYLLGVSTLEPRKNFDHLIRCYVRLVQQERLTDLRLVVVGARGWKYESIFTELRRAGLPDNRIVLTGYVPDADMAPLYSGALAFVYPSLYEGFGLPPLEAMQCGTPVITSNTSSLPEVVGEAGIMVDPRDADALSAAMLRLYRDGALRAELARRSLERAARFSWERTAEQTVAAYHSALETK